MYVSLRWVQQLVQLPTLSLSLLLDRLILAGFEVDNIERKNLGTEVCDIILDISITANRADSSNFKGFINELVALVFSDLICQKLVSLKPLILGIPLQEQKTPQFLGSLDLLHNKKQHPSFYSTVFQDQMNAQVFFKPLLFHYSLWEHYKQKNHIFLDKTKNLSSNFRSNFTHSIDFIPILQEISNCILVKKSPNWIKKRLLLMNFKPINNIIDTINYILIETGQVFFTYDISALQEFTKTSNFNFIPKRTIEDIEFSISESETIFLSHSALVLTLNKKVISLFGLLQDYNTVITKKTVRFLLHTNLYDAYQVKQLSKSLGLKTEYSIKLEKQVDLNLLEQAYWRLIYLFKVQGIHFETTNSQHPNLFIQEKICSNLVLKYIKQSQSKIKVFLKNINEILGPLQDFGKLEPLQIVESLRALNFKLLGRTDEYFNIVVPLQRQYDIEQEVDIIEEIVRVVGFHQFLSILPSLKRVGKITKLERLKRQLRTSFLNFGFNESILSSISYKSFESPILLKNPLFSESSILRPSLLKILLEKAKFNRNIIRGGFETFEIGRVYKVFENSNRNKEELELISGLFGGKVFRSTWKSDDSISTINWFEAKGLLENILTKLSISLTWRPAELQYHTIFHPTRTANLFSKTAFVGTFGQIHPIIAVKENLNQQTYLFEFKLEELNKVWRNKTSITFTQYSLYPISSIDLSCITRKSLSFQVIKNKILKLGQPLLRSIELFDYYDEPPIKPDYCNLSFKLQFTSNTRTLINSEIDKIITEIVCSLENEFAIHFN